MLRDENPGRLITVSAPTMWFPEISIRYAIIFALAVVAAYLGVSLTSLIQLRMSQRAAVRSQTPGSDDADWLTPGGEAAPAAPGPVEKWRRPSPPDDAPTQRDAGVARHDVDTELRQLRDDLAAIREHVARLKAIARRISPKYDQATVLAECGVDARDIAAQCGVSALEAELLLALNDNQLGSEAHDR